MSTTATESADASSLRELVRHGSPRGELASWLDALSPDARAAEALALRGRDVGRLYRCAAGGRRLSPVDFVSTDAAQDQTTIFQGRNSLPLFTGFEKRFARTPSGAVIGYNHGVTSWLTGPGYFVVSPPDDDADVPGELYFDYTSEPHHEPEGWPPFKPNTRGISYFVYAHMMDYMREVTDGIVVGAAYKRGKAIGQYFVLCRSGSVR